MHRFFFNKVVCITGSSQGIGHTTALTLGKFGAKICLNGRNPGKLKLASDRLRDMGIDSFPVQGDLSNPSGCKLVIDGCVKHFGKIDILINNAGIASRGRLLETTPEAWDETMRANFNSAVGCTYYALPHLLKTKGSVIFISSMAGKVGVPGHASYSASKMALTAYTNAMQNEFSNKDLHCGLIFVGFTDNENRKQILSPDGTYKTIPKRKGIKLSSREDVAMSIAQCIVDRKQVITLTFMGKLQHVMLKFAPWVVNFILRKTYKDYDKTYEED